MSEQKHPPELSYTALTEVLANTETLNLLTRSTALLSLDKIANLDRTRFEKMIANPAFSPVFQDFGWPSRSTSFTRTSMVYDSDKEFEECLFLGSEEVGKKALNNFHCYLKAELHDWTGTEPMKSGKINMIDITYGTKPVVARAWLVYPELMGALNSVFKQRANRFNYDESFGELPPEAVTGAHAAYRFLASLITPDDTRLQLQFTFGTQGHFPQDTNIHDLLQQ